MNIKNNLPIILICIIILSSTGYVIYASYLLNSPNNIIELNLTENLKLSYSGIDGSGKVEVLSNELNISSKQKEKVLKLLTYEINPSKGLINGETIKVVVVFDEDKMSKLGYKGVNTEKEYTVAGLTKNKNIKTKINDQGLEVEIIDGIEVPTSWGLTTKEKQDYVNYQKSIQNLGEYVGDPIPAPCANWYQGQNKYSKELIDKAFNNYEEANLYGLYSNQEYTIEILDTSASNKYLCRFRKNNEPLLCK